MAAPFTVTSVSNYNANPPPDDGSQIASNRVQWSTQKTKLADPVFNAFNSSETATNTAFGKVVGGAGITTTAVSYTVTSADQSKKIKATVSGVTITTPDATVVGSPFVFSVLNNSTGNITFAGNGSQTIDGATSLIIPSGCGCMVNTDGSNWFTDGLNFNNVSGIQNYLSGLTLSTAGSSSTFGIASGTANDSTNVKIMQLASAYTKTTATWAVGTGNGALDTGSIANSTWYHVFLIYRPDTGVVDVLFSLSATSPTMPTSYTLFRRIGSMLTDSSAHWTLFSQNGNEFLWTVPIVDLAILSVGLGAVTPTLTVPTGVKVNALGIGTIQNSVQNTAVLMSSLDTTDTTPATNGIGITALQNAATTLITNIRTNTSAQIRARSASNSTTVLLTTQGWIDSRGQK